MINLLARALYSSIYYFQEHRILEKINEFRLASFGRANSKVELFALFQNNSLFLDDMIQKKIWHTIAWQSFGGPTAQISLMYKLLVEEKKFIQSHDFQKALNFCMFLPGPEAQQLATYLGWLLNGTKGGLYAGLVFILPGFLSILFLSYLYIFFQENIFMKSLLLGFRLGIIVILISAISKLIQKNLTTRMSVFLMIFAFLGLYLFNLNFPLIVIFAGFMGYFFIKNETSTHTISKMPSLKQTLKTFFSWSFVWLLPIFICLIVLGRHSLFFKLSVFFSKMSLVTFGGAYSALNYVSELVVEKYHWITNQELMDALSLAESTPGPLIQAVQFIGFMSAYKNPIISSPFFSATIASVLVTWVTFLPSFLWIFTFAPYVEFINQNSKLQGFLKGISAAVIGVMINLALIFIFQTLFTNNLTIQNQWINFQLPYFSSLQIQYLAIVCLMTFLHYKFKLKTIFLLIIPSLMILIEKLL